MTLRLDYCSRDAALYATKHWHYSHKISAGMNLYIGVWEDAGLGEQFIGAVVFGRGANREIGTEFNCGPTEVCELTRVALTDHVAPVSRVLAIAIKLLRRQAPGLRLIISYADRRQAHVGTIYQANGWTHLGLSMSGRDVQVDGKWMHSRTASLRMVKRNGGSIAGLPSRPHDGKYRYGYPLDKAMADLLYLKRQPYPKTRRNLDLREERDAREAELRESCAASSGGAAGDDQSPEGGSTPTAALQNTMPGFGELMQKSLDKKARVRK